MNRRAFLQSLGGSLPFAGGYLTYLTQPALGSLLTPSPARSNTAWLDLANGCAFVYAANVVAPQHRSHYLSKARLCLLRYKETVR